MSRFVQVYARDINEETIIGLNEKRKNKQKLQKQTYIHIDIPGGISLII
jgi:hypothetical protein